MTPAVFPSRNIGFNGQPDAQWRILHSSRRLVVSRQIRKQRGLRWLQSTLLALCLLVTPTAAFAARQISASDIGQALTGVLNLPTGGLGETRIVLDNQTLSLTAGDEDLLDFSGMNYDAATRRFVGTALVRSNGKVSAQLPIAGRVVTELEVPVLARNMQRDEVITGRDLAWQRITLSSSTQQVLARAEDIIGKAPRTAVRAGQLLRPADLIAPAIIKRGSMVTLLYRSGSLTLTAKGRALNDAAAGEPVRVANSASSRTVEGITLNDGTVQLSGNATN